MDRSVIRHINDGKEKVASQARQHLTSIIRLSLTGLFVCLLLGEHSHKPLYGQESLDPLLKIDMLEFPPGPGWGPGLIPVHGPVDFLDRLQKLAKESPGEAADDLRSWLLSRQGELITHGPAPLYEESWGESPPPLTLKSPEIILQEWSKNLPSEFLQRILSSLENLPLSGSHPLIWASGKEQEALNALEEAIEKGDRSTANILLRRPGLAKRIPDTLLQWVKKPPSTSHSQHFFSTKNATAATPAGMELLQLLQWKVEDRPLQIASTHKDWVKSKESLLPTRRSTLPGVHGLIRNGVMIVGSDLSVEAHHSAPEKGMLWSWSPHKSSITEDSSTPDAGTRIPLSSGNKIMFLLRSSRIYQTPNTNVVMDHLLQKNRDQQKPGWLEATILEVPDPESPPISHWTLPLAIEGFTLAPTPLWSGDRLWCVATRGFNDVETWVFEFDTEKKKEVWRRHLDTRPIQFHSHFDLRQIIASVHIDEIDGQLWIDRSPGIVDRVCAKTGEHLGVTLPPRHRLMKEEASGVTLHWGQFRFKTLQSLRPAGFPVSVISRQRQQRISIPPLSLRALMIDTFSGEMLWHHPVLPGESILGVSQDQTTIWIADSRIERGKNELRIRGIDTREGKSIGPVTRLPLGADPSGESFREFESPELHPILLGDMQYFNDRLMVPTVAGLEWFHLKSGTSLKFLTWPHESTGGSIFPISNDGQEWGLIHRGDLTRETKSHLEVWTTSDVRVQPSEKR